MTKILYSITAYPPSTGGAQSHLHQLVAQLRVRHDLQVVSFWDTNRFDWLLGTTLRVPELGRDYQEDGVPVHTLGLTTIKKLSLLPWVLLYYPFMRYAIPQIADVLAPVIDKWCDGVELIHNVRIGREPLSYASLHLARKRDIPFVLTPLHHPRWGGFLHRYYHALYRQADAVIVLTEAEGRQMVQLGVNSARIHVTGHGPILAAEGQGQRFREKHQLGENPYVLFLGQKYPYKGVEAVVKAAKIVWEKAPDVRFVFIGPRTKFSEQLFSSIHDPRYLELGIVDLQEKTDALAACNLLCVPSSQESFGGVYTEAWSLGKPVIGCSIPAVREVIDDGMDGYLVEQKPPQVADRILELLLNPACAGQMGEKGKIKVQERFSWQRLAQMTERIYEEVLQA